MNYLSLIAFVLVSALPQDDALTCPAGNLLREWRGNTTRVSGEGYYVLRDADAWTAFWTSHAGGEAPKVDFEHEMAIAIFPADQVEIGWIRVTHAGPPGLSKFWIGLCPSPKGVASQIAVVGRSDLAAVLLGGRIALQLPG